MERTPGRSGLVLLRQQCGEIPDVEAAAGSRVEGIKTEPLLINLKHLSESSCFFISSIWSVFLLRATRRDAILTQNPA